MEMGMNDEELELDKKIEAEMIRIGEEAMKERLEAECEDCGGKTEEMELCLLGLDVEALFPSMTSARTGEIVRRRMMKSKMKVEGFQWKVGLVYILMNKHLTTNLGKMWKILPYRRKVGGNAPGMASKAMVGKDGDVEDQWIFKTKEVSKEQLMEIVARCTEIAIRIIFENFMYNFGGKTRLQRKGGPIGARLTMACSRVVMQEWGEKYRRILVEARLVITLFKIYVDDVRQVSTVLKMGTRYNAEVKKLVVVEEAVEEDEKLKREGETTNARMARILLPAMNAINSDLSFTVEIGEDFKDQRLPTLDCKLWFNEDWSLNHTYFEKEMKSQMMIPEKSAMPETQRMNILSNDLVRRVSNVKLEQAEEGKVLRIVDQYTGQLKTSGRMLAL